MNRIPIEIAYANEKEQLLFCCKVPLNTSIAAAIEYANLAKYFPEIDLEKNSVGIFGKKVSLNTQVKAGDRIEIYRELFIDPKEARRLRANKKHL